MLGVFKAKYRKSCKISQKGLQLRNSFDKIAVKTEFRREHILIISWTQVIYYRRIDKSAGPSKGRAPCQRK